MLQNQNKCHSEQYLQSLSHEESQTSKEILRKQIQRSDSQNDRGITLIALVVTLVVLLILAGVTINVMLSEGGIIAKAQSSKEKQEVGVWLDRLTVTEANTAVTNHAVDMEKYNAQLKTEGIVLEDNSNYQSEDGGKTYNLTTDNGYVFNISEPTPGDIVINYIGKNGELLPFIKEIKVISTTTNSAKIEVDVARLEDGKITYEYKEHAEESYTLLKENKELTAEFIGLTQNETYDIKVTAENKNGKSEAKIISIYTGKLQEGTISQKGETVWSNNQASIELQTTDTVNTMQYQKNDITGTWTNYTGAITGLVYQDRIYARMFDGTNGNSPFSVDILDDIQPQTATINLSKTTTDTATPITATVIQVDNESGVDVIKCKWVYNTTSGSIGTAESSYTGGAFSTNSQTISLNANVAGTYYLHVLTVDKEGNEKESISNAVTVEKKVVADGSYSDEKRVNTPKLGTGMTPVKWNGSTFVTTTINDSNWYNYYTKQWANARTSDGSIWVWISRYAYQIVSNYHTEISGTINIEFMKGTSNISSNGRSSFNNASGQGNWNIHPAFNYGSQVSGIWVAKYEASRSDSTISTSGSSGIVKIQPTVQSLRYTVISQISDAYDMAINYNPRLNSHLIKNSEWGAVAYLSKSSYGKGTEIGKNECNGYITGMGTGGNADFSGGEYVYNASYIYSTTQGQKASTTGNVYGIYDMSGGSEEYSSAYVNNNNITNSSLAKGDAKNREVYDLGRTDYNSWNYEANSSKYGDAVYETSNGYVSDSKSWGATCSYFPYQAYPFFLRGGRYSNVSGAGIFAFNCEWGTSYSNFSFRPVLIIT